MKREFNFTLMFLLETHISGQRATNIVKRLGFDGWFLQEAIGHVGGIWCVWDRNQWQVDVLASSNQLVHLKVSKGNQVPWLLTGIYESPHYA